MVKKLTGLLCALALLASMVALAALPVSAAELDASFSAAKTTNEQYLDTKTYPKAVYSAIEFNSVTTTEVGTYTLPAFTMDLDFWNKSVTQGQDKNETTTLKIGKLSILLIKDIYQRVHSITKIKVTYDGAEIALNEWASLEEENESYFVDAQLLDIDLVGDDYREFRKEFFEAVKDKIDENWRCPNTLYKLHITYKNGTLTIATPNALTDAGKKWRVTCQLPKADFTNATIGAQVDQSNGNNSCVILADLHLSDTVADADVGLGDYTGRPKKTTSKATSSAAASSAEVVSKETSTEATESEAPAVDTIGAIEDTTSGPSPWLWVGIGCGVAVIAAAVVVVILLKKKKA